jgi:cold shock CspA family protein
MPGEYIVENAAEKYGEDFINDINKGIIKKYKSGGLVLPGVSNVVTSNFGPRRTGLKGASTYHKGIDLRAPMGSPIKAIQNGTVTGINNTWGKVSIRHSDGSTSSYLHLSSIGVNKGENIQQGQRIGAAGKTGPIPGMSPHLHLSLQSPNGAYLNPLDVLMANGVPLQQKNGNVPSTDTMYAQTDTSGANTPSAFGPSTSSTGLSISDMFKNAVFSSAELSGTTKNSDITSLESAKSILNGEIDKRLKENRLKIAQNRKKNNNVSIASVSGDNNQSIVSNPVPIFKTAFGV